MKLHCKRWTWNWIITYFEFNQNFWICFIDRLLVSGCSLNELKIESQHFRNAACLCWDCEWRRCRISMISLYFRKSENKTFFSSSVNLNDFLSSIVSNVLLIRKEFFSHKNAIAIKIFATLFPYKSSDFAIRFRCVNNFTEINVFSFKISQFFRFTQKFKQILNWNCLLSIRLNEMLTKTQQNITRLVKRNLSTQWQSNENCSEDRSAFILSS